MKKGLTNAGGGYNSYELFHIPAFLALLADSNQHSVDHSLTYPYADPNQHSDANGY